MPACEGVWQVVQMGLEQRGQLSTRPSVRDRYWWSQSGVGHGFIVVRVLRWRAKDVERRFSKRWRPKKRSSSGRRKTREQVPESPRQRSGISRSLSVMEEHWAMKQVRQY